MNFFYQQPLDLSVIPRKLVQNVDAYDGSLTCILEQSKINFTYTVQLVTGQSDHFQLVLVLHLFTTCGLYMHLK